MELLLVDDIWVFKRSLLPSLCPWFELVSDESVADCDFSKAIFDFFALERNEVIFSQTINF